MYAHGKEFAVHAVSDYDTRQLWHDMNINNFFQIDKWAKSGYVDSVMILVTRPRWDAVKRPAQIKEFHDKIKDTKAKLSIMVQLRNNDSMLFAAEAIKNKYLDEVILYEEQYIHQRNSYNAISTAIKQANEVRSKN